MMDKNEKSKRPRIEGKTINIDDNNFHELLDNEYYNCHISMAPKAWKMYMDLTALSGGVVCSTESFNKIAFDTVN